MKILNRLSEFENNVFTSIIYDIILPDEAIKTKVKSSSTSLYFPLNEDTKVGNSSKSSKAEPEVEFPPKNTFKTSKNVLGDDLKLPG